MTFEAYNTGDLRELARHRLPKSIFEFVDRGTEDKVSLHDNNAALRRIRLKPRTLIDVSRRSQEITLFSHKQPMPIAIAPTGFAGLMWHNGEIHLARAAKAAGIPFALATNSLTAMETVAEQAGGRLWFQLYLWQQRQLSYKLVERARAAGFEALILTVDGAVGSNREYNKRNHFRIPLAFTARNVNDVLRHPGWLFGVLGRYVMRSGLPRFENYPPEVSNRIIGGPMGARMSNNPSLSYGDLRELRRTWPRTLMIKGVLHPRDAQLAADCGVDGIIVSNHGGRNLDGSVAPIQVLPEIVDAVGKRVTVIVDSGFRRGSNVVKGLALGAHAVLIGRAMLYGTALGGEAGGTRAIEFYREEIDRVLALLGCTDVAALSPEYMVMPR
jgi:isopentenyl diphosphate isomerase/L-lactate dehydrogenase-like FMN-dependent dehydrogenase